MSVSDENPMEVIETTEESKKLETMHPLQGKFEVPGSEATINDSTKEMEKMEAFIGTPLQSSSPATAPVVPLTPLRRIMEGGDADSSVVRSFQNLLSPIHRSRACHQFNLGRTTQTQRFPSGGGGGVLGEAFPNGVPQLERTLSGLEKKSNIPVPIKKSGSAAEKENILTEKISNMVEEDAKKLLKKVIKDNMELRQELRVKEKKIAAFKGQMYAMLEWKAKQEMDAFSEFSSSEDSNSDVKAKNLNPPKSPPRKTKKKLKEETSESDENSGVNEIIEKSRGENQAQLVQNVQVVEEVYGFRRMSLSFIQELASTIDVDQELLRHRIKDGCYMTNQFLIGGVAGWLTALFVKKFGKLALSAAGGGLLLLIYTTRKGYVNVNYDSIYQEISRICDKSAMEEPFEEDAANKAYSMDLSRINSSSTLKMGGLRDEVSSENALNKGTTAWDRVKSAKRWVASHTYTVSGFVLTFAYNVI